MSPGGRWRFPRAEPVVLGNGLLAELVDMPGQLVASVAVVVDLPTAAEPAGLEGVLAGSAALLAADPAGTGSGPALARLGATVTSGCDHRGPKVVADCAAPALPTLFGALARMVFGSCPTEPSLDVVLRRHRAERAHELADPFALANSLLNETVTAPTSRYARPLGGTEESLRRIRLDDVRAVLGRIDPARTTVVVAGDLAGTDVRTALEDTLGSVPASGTAGVDDVPAEPAGTPRVVCRPGVRADQTQLMFGCFAIDRTDPRWPSARVLAELLGAGPGSLLNRELRGRLALTYGVQVRFLPYAVGGLFVVSGTVDSARSEESVDAVLRVLAELRDGVPAGLFERVRQRMVDTAPEVYESSLGVAQQFAELVSCRLPRDFVDDHVHRLRNLTADTVLADARTLVDPQALSLVAVGRLDPGRTAMAGLPAG